MDSRNVSRRWASAVVGLVVAFGFAPPAAASFVASIDAFAVLQSGANFTDQFANGLEPPEGADLGNVYQLIGTFPDGTEAGDRLTLDPANGVLTMNAAGTPRLTNGAVLLTDTTGANPLGLYQDEDLIVGGLFDIVPLEGPFSTYAVFVRDFVPPGAREQLQVQVQRNDVTAPGLNRISFVKQVFVGPGSGITTIDNIAFAPPPEATRIALRLVHVADTDSFTASYRYWDDTGPLSDFIDLAGSGTMFNDRIYVRAGFFASAQPIPEPSAYALFAAGLFGVAWIALRRRVNGEAAVPGDSAQD